VGGVHDGVVGGPAGEEVEVCLLIKTAALVHRIKVHIKGTLRSGAIGNGVVDKAFTGETIEVASTRACYLHWADWPEAVLDLVVVSEALHDSGLDQVIRSISRVQLFSQHLRVDALASSSWI